MRSLAPGRTSSPRTRFDNSSGAAIAAAELMNRRRVMEVGIVNSLQKISRRGAEFAEGEEMLLYDLCAAA
jgi:hypothetical protein